MTRSMAASTSNNYGDVPPGDVGDTITGGEGIDSIYGDEGDDRVNSGAGDDQVWGGEADDDLFGDLGNDRIKARPATMSSMVVRIRTLFQAALIGTASMADLATTIFPVTQMPIR